jgi:hypothetical protein
LDYSYLSASNGSGDAALMHVTAPRIVGATTISVDSVVNVPAKFIATSGTLLSTGLIDPTTKVDFYGYINSGSLVIEGFMPGNTDLGNTSGQIVVIKPNTGHMDELVALAQVAHNDDGSLKQAVLAALYPIGSIFTATVGTNPNTLLGFGTWVAFAQGQVMVGIAPTGTFTSAGVANGSESVNLAHNHATDVQGAHSHSGTTSNGNYNGGASNVLTQSTAYSPPGHNHTFGTDVQGAHSHNITNALGATSVIQPSITVYIWNRTA